MNFGVLGKFRTNCALLCKIKHFSPFLLMYKNGNPTPEVITSEIFVCNRGGESVDFELGQWTCHSVTSSHVSG